jgi:Cytochrome bd terminal oxidase subunit I
LAITVHVPDTNWPQSEGTKAPTMHLDPVILSRIQFAWVVGWHILLPAFTVGLASFIAFLEGAYTLTERRIFLDLSQFWLRIFAVSFGTLSDWRIRSALFT